MNFKKHLLISMLVLLALALALATPVTAQADLAVFVRQHYEAVNRGDVAAAVAVFTDDAVYVGGSCRPANPCKGKVEVQREIERQVRNQQRFAVINLQVSGSSVTARAGLERTIATATVTFTGDKISRLARAIDESDPQTAQFSNFIRVVNVTSPRITALNRGDVAGAMATFADDAVFEGLGLCAATPCVGKAAIQKEMEREVADHTIFTGVGVSRASGDTLTGSRSEIRSDSIKAAGIERIIASGTTVIKGDKISSIRHVLDTTDAQTAKFAASQKLPTTGAESSINHAWLIALTGLALLALGRLWQRSREHDR